MNLNPKDIPTEDEVRQVMSLFGFTYCELNDDFYKKTKDQEIYLEISPLYTLSDIFKLVFVNLGFY